MNEGINKGMNERGTSDHAPDIAVKCPVSQVSRGYHGTRAVHCVHV